MQKGQMDHQLSQVSTSLKFGPVTNEVQEESEFETISRLGRSNVAYLDFPGYGNEPSRIRVYDFETTATLGSEGIRQSAHDLRAHTSVSQGSVSRVHF